MNTPSMNLRELFESALALAPAARAPFLDKQCPDAGVRARVELLLRADASEDEPVSSASVDNLAREIGDASAPAPPPGSRIGPFEIVRVIGEGGSSTVFEAHRELEGARQYVALKLLRQNLLSPEARRRFGREQRALIRLEHPNIARMIDAGLTPEGLAYIALELVDGVPITDFARANALGARERLQMFATVCRAVDAAHRALIVHRDIKPSNVLVTAEGEVKLLDFGIAKLLADETGQEATVLQAFTPAYAAPEQVDGGVITTATDVYALGVVLGELLTGERGHGGATPSADVPAARESGVARSSRTTQRLSGDLYAVVAKATEADPLQRYASAGEFAEEIRRVLEGRPVHARPQTRWYRMRRFVARHRGGVAASIAFLVVLVAALGVALWQARVAHDEAARANRQTQHAETVRDFLVSVFETAQADVPRERRPTVEQLVDDAGDKLLRDDVLAGDTRVELLLALAKVNGAIGAYEREHALLDRATADLDRLNVPSDDVRLRVRVLRAGVYVAQAKPNDAIALIEPLRASLVTRGGAASVDALLVLVDALSGANRSDEAQAVAADARRLAERVVDGRELLLLRVDATRARHLVGVQKFGEGLALADAAWTRWKAQSRDIPRDAIDLLSSIALAAEFSGDLQRADAAYREAIAVVERLYVRPHPDVATAVGIYGSFLVAKARYEEAEPYVLRALAMRRALLGDAHPDTLNSLAALGRLRSGQVRRDEARAAEEEGVGICRREHIRHNVCPRLIGSLSQILAAQGDLVGARKNAEEAVAMQRELTGDGSAQLVGPLGQLARAQVKQASYADALTTTDELLAIAARNGSGGSKEAHYAQFQRALALYGLGRNREALDLATDVVAVHKKQTPDEKTTLFSMLALEARALAREHRFDEARPVAAEALAIARKPQPADPAMMAELAHLANGGRAD
jgi:tRNA A-37 threonylcarbamoyl transferase component Bud32